MLESDTLSDRYDSPDEDDSSPAQLISFYWSLLRKYYWILLLTSIVVGTGGYFFTKQMPRLYKTSAKIIFHQNQANVFGRSIERVDLFDPGGRWQFDQFWSTQYQVLTSRWFAERVVTNLDLLKDGSHIPLEDGQGQAYAEDVRQRMGIGMVQGMVEFSLQDESRVALVSVSSNDPELAAAVANEYADTYIDYAQEFQSGGLNEIVEFFDGRVGTMRDQLLEARKDLQTFKSDHSDSISTSYEDELNTTAADIEAANTELNEVDNDLASSEAMLSQLKKMQKAGESEVDVALFAGSETLTTLVSQRRDLRQELVELLTVFGKKHEKVVGVQDQLKIVEDGIQEEVTRSISNVSNRVEFLKRQRASIRARKTGHQQEASHLIELGKKYYEIKDRADTLKDLYDKVLMRSDELDINSMYESQMVKVLEAAEVPTNPFSPNVPYNLGLSLVLGLLLGGGVIFLIAALDNTVKSEEDVRRYTSVPLLGALPAVDASTMKTLTRAGGESPLDIITHLAPKSSFAEGIKTLRTNLMFMQPKSGCLFGLVTSPGPGEGKTLISTNLSIAIAQSGRRTLLIDNDLRRPRVHKALGVENTLGLADVLAHETTLDEAIQPTDVDNLFVLPAGHIPHNPTELLHTEQFEDVLGELRDRFDRVIFDSPPIGAVADALILSQTVDAVLLVLKFGQSRRDMLKRSIEQLEGIGAPLIGVVLNDIKRDAGYGYQYYYYHQEGYGDRPDEEPKKSKKSKKMAS